METISERRLRKLKALVDTRGLSAIADAAGLSAAALDQVLKGTLMKAKRDGTRSAKSLGDASARKIEDALDLGRGWFDADDLGASASEMPATPQEESSRANQLAAAIELITNELINADAFTRGLVRHSLSQLGLDSGDTVNISRKIADLLVTKNTESGSRHDPPRTPAKVGVVIGRSASQDLGGHDGRGNRDAGTGSAKR